MVMRRRKKKAARSVTVTASMRKPTTEALKQAASYLFFHYRYACHLEIGVMPWGRRRADVVAVKLNGQIVIVEVKSCVADFRTDTKWTEYLPYCHKFYLAMMPQTWDKLKQESETVKLLSKHGVGVIGLMADGYAKIMRPATEYEMDDDKHRSLLARLAWRAADLSKRNRRTRERVFVEQSTDGTSTKKA